MRITRFKVTAQQIRARYRRRLSPEASSLRACLISNLPVFEKCKHPALARIIAEDLVLLRTLAGY